ncbi:SLBB domain-containing protein [Paucibacter sp. DJ2R-2]|uniref:SLBB domain-containing protein n=1 Tax=Paucibacter sp. DJ2R-2 TaxID=2893558 RepID=UPI0021E3DD21|nr:SLBB domain-containing protein [Paucibacter sp. DJ2R-2]MCV2423097.1 SLBB domain-containing protein [Paucibacter sp. DJ4R-1]MCV2440993.1 SLBB domain-containing protein [Paucibacter sp. DJ2R-2]
MQSYSKRNLMKYYDSWKSSPSRSCDGAVLGFTTQCTSFLKRGTRSRILIAGQILALVVVASPTHAAEVAVESGPIRLQSPNRGVDAREESIQTNASARSDQQKSTPLPPPYQPGEFERYVQRSAGGTVEIRRFGSELMSPNERSNFAQEASSQIPLDYLINSGDELQVSLWGSVDADLRLTVDRSGRITLPRVGPIMVAGLRYADLEAAIDKRVAQVFRNYKLSVSLGRLRSIRIYVTGFTQRPGAYTVNSLSTLVNALMHAGGPSSAGSFRQIELRRGGKSITTFDFYELLINGNKSADRLLQAEDVIHIGPVGVQVALIGSVNKPAVFEIKPGENIDSLLSMAGGFTAVADRSRLAIEHLDTRNDVRISELALPQQKQQQPRNGDLLRAFSAVDTSLPQHRQSRRIKVEGEVHRPGEYILPANSTVSDALKAAGGLTTGAFLYGTEFNRESVRTLQQENYDRVLRDLETELSRSSSTQKAISADESIAQAARAQNSTKLLERLRSLRPNGRVVLQLAPGAANLPDLQLEDGDRLSIPSRPTTVGVFGSVFNAGSYLHINGGTITDFLKLAGGTTRGADTNSLFVLRANGSVVSARQRTGWLMGGGGLDGVSAEPGDTVFVPEELNKTTFIQEAKEWTQIFAQFGLGIAAIRTLTK